MVVSHTHTHTPCGAWHPPFTQTSVEKSRERKRGYSSPVLICCLWQDEMRFFVVVVVGFVVGFVVMYWKVCVCVRMCVRG